MSSQRAEQANWHQRLLTRLPAPADDGVVSPDPTRMMTAGGDGFEFTVGRGVRAQTSAIIINSPAGGGVVSPDPTRMFVASEDGLELTAGRVGLPIFVVALAGDGAVSLDPTPVAVADGDGIEFGGDGFECDAGRVGLPIGGDGFERTAGALARPSAFLTQQVPVLSDLIPHECPLPAGTVLNSPPGASTCP